MRVLAKTLAVGDVEAQMVSLVGGGVFVLMQQDDESDRSSDGHCDVGAGCYGDSQVA